MLRWLMIFVIAGIATMTLADAAYAQDEKGFFGTVTSWFFGLFDQEEEQEVAEIVLETQKAPANITYRYYFGQFSWVYDSGTNSSGWEAPVTNVSYRAYDFRDRSGRSQRGGEAVGYAIFSYAEEVSHPNLTYLGNRDAELSRNTVRDLEGKLQVTLSSNTVRDVIVEMYTVHSDPTGQGVPTPIPDSNGRITIPSLNYSNKINITEPTILNAKILRRHWDIYRGLRDRTKDLPEGHFNKDQHLRYLDTLLEQYDTDNHTVFIPPDLEDEGVKKHRTTITDGFDTYGDGDLATVSSGAWVNTDNGFNVASNQAQPQEFATNFVTYDTELDSVNHYCEVTVIAEQFNTGVGCMVRINDSTDNAGDFYYFSAEDDSSNDTVEILRVDDGTKTSLASQDCGCGEFTNGTRLRLEIDGTTLTAIVDGKTELSTTDSTFAGAGFAGMYGGRDTQRLDDWEAGDLAAADQPAGYLDVTLNGSDFLVQNQNLTANVSINATCEGAGGCGPYNVTMYRSVVGGSGQTDIPVNVTVKGLPVYNSTGLLNQSFASLSDAGILTYVVTWNFTGAPGVYNATFNLSNGTTTGVNGSRFQFNITLPEPLPEDSCTYVSGDWEITDYCFITTDNDIRPNKFRVLTGGFAHITGTVRAGGCFLEDGAGQFVDDTGGLFCTSE